MATKNDEGGRSLPAVPERRSGLAPSRPRAVAERILDDATWAAVPVLAVTLGLAAEVSAMSLRNTAGGIALLTLGTTLLFASLFLVPFGFARQSHSPASLLRSLLALLPASRSVRRAEAALEGGWDRARASVEIEHPASVIFEPRRLQVDLPEGGRVTVIHRWKGRPLVALGTAEPGLAKPFDATSSLGMASSSRVLAALEAIQGRRLAALLGIPEGSSPTALSIALARAVPTASSDKEAATRRNDFAFHDEHVVERREIEALGISVLSVRPKGSQRHVDVIARGPGFHLMSLPAAPFSRTIRSRRESEVERAFGATSDTVRVPTFLGNARASRIAELAARALGDDPDLADPSGAPIRTLVEQHMPRLLATHRNSTRTARSSDIPSIDADLDRGLDVVARALGAAIDAMNDRKMDALRTEVRFLESRHPSAEPDLSASKERERKDP